MNKRDDMVYLRHILDAIARIEEYLQEVTQETFHKYYPGFLSHCIR